MMLQESHKFALTNLYTTITEDLLVKYLLPVLVEKQAFSEAERNRITEKSSVSHHQCADVIHLILKKSDEVYNIFKLALRSESVGQGHIADALEHCEYV